ncbi:MAG: LytTR family DNA-binding domain-containing protein [Bacteriovoracaceae bacterium]|nr:LytTR family DNA-binding domain-containing protein [Bacteroidota bacterium]
MIRAIIVDDEPLAREKVQLFANDESDIEIVELCTNGQEAIASFHRHKPDLLFLDIQMPEINGFDVLKHLQLHPPLPEIIFITAYDEFALRAFEFHALDYLLKPYDRERFTKAVAYARNLIASRPQSDVTTEQIKALLDSLKQSPSKLERLIVKTNGRIIFLRIDEIDWMEAAGNYIKLHVGNETHLMRETMNKMEEQLSSQQFIRIHRGTIINIAKIKELQPYFNGEYKVTLQNNTTVILSRGYRDNFTTVLGKPL